MELEKLGPAELERVKAKGYQGGLRVTSQDNPTHGLRTYDLLVGLHVWPTESLKQVTEILQRDDLDQLTPLKYYAIRKVYGGKEKFSGDSVGKDEVVTGRIEVNLDGWRAMRERGNPPALEDPGPGIPTVQPTLQGATIDQGTTWNPIVSRPHLSAPDPLPVPMREPMAQPLYDGKTFDEWREAWRQDLSPEYRIQAVRSFVAFANASEGQQAEAAVHQILQIAEKYDWSTIGRNKLIQPLQEACIAVFDQGQIPSQLAIRAIITFPNAEKNKKFLSFLEYILPKLAQSYPEGNKVLRNAFPDLKIPEFIAPEDRADAKGGGPKN